MQANGFYTFDDIGAIYRVSRQVVFERAKARNIVGVDVLEKYNHRKFFTFQQINETVRVAVEWLCSDPRTI